MTSRWPQSEARLKEIDKELDGSIEEVVTEEVHLRDNKPFGVQFFAEWKGTRSKISLTNTALLMCLIAALIALVLQNGFL